MLNRFNPTLFNFKIFMIAVCAVAVYCLLHQGLCSLLITRRQQISSSQIHELLNQITDEVQEPMPSNDLYLKFLSYFDEKRFEGTWVVNQHNSNNVSIFNYIGGKTIKQQQKYLSDPKSIYPTFSFLKGNYSDNGEVQLILRLGQLEVNYTHEKGNYKIYSRSNFTGKLKQKTIDSSSPWKQTIIKSFNMSFKNQDSQLQVSVHIQTQQFTLNVQNYIENWNTHEHLFLSTLLCIIFVIELFGSIRIQKKLSKNKQCITRYSSITFFLMFIWDKFMGLTLNDLVFKNNYKFFFYILPLLIDAFLKTPTSISLLSTISSNNLRVIIKIVKKYFILGIMSLTLFRVLVKDIYNYQLFYALLPLIFFPQLYKNAQRKTKLEIDYLQILLPRFLFILYHKGYSNNIYNIQPSYYSCLVIFSLLTLSITLLLIQMKFGNRSIFPNCILPYCYDDFSICYSNDVESNDQNCSICLSSIQQQPKDNENSLRIDNLHKLMITPCHHKFHYLCLTQWMRYKLQCPTCRKRLEQCQQQKQE